MDVARLNFSHQSFDWHAERLALVKEIAEEFAYPIGVLQDLPGPKVRVGGVHSEAFELRPGSRFTLCMGEVEPTSERVSVSYPELSDAVQEGDPILLADGRILLRVEEVHPDAVVTAVEIGGRLRSKQGLNLPTRSLDLPALTDFDREAMIAGLEMGVDFVAMSFVRRASDIEDARDLMRRHGRELPIIAKIEKHEALENLAEIVEAVDGVMVARGDLAVEIPLEDVPRAQKHIIAACNTTAKPVITATQMLGSMVESPRPTRAETTDVAHALYDGTDAVMLSEETAVGRYPVQSVEIMHRICKATEQVIVEEVGGRRPVSAARRHRIPDAVASAACLLAEHLDADALVVPTRTGSTAIKVSVCRPRQPIVAIGTDPAVVGRMAVVWGVHPIYGREMDTHEEMLLRAERRAEAAGLVEPGDLLVITAGFPVGGPGTTNTVTVKVVGEKLDGSTARRQRREASGHAEPGAESDAEERRGPGGDEEPGSDRPGEPPS